jgi:hypothetical protein
LIIKNYSSSSQRIEDLKVSPLLRDAAGPYSQHRPQDYNGVPNNDFEVVQFMKTRFMEIAERHQKSERRQVFVQYVIISALKL